MRKSARLPAAGQTAVSDPVMDIGLMLGAATTARTEADAACAGAEGETRQRFEETCDALDDHIDALVDAALSQPAKSLSGAMLQAALILHYAEFENDKVRRRCEFAAHSIITLLAAKSRVDAETLGIDYFAGVGADLPDRFASFIDGVGKVERNGR